MTRKRHSAKGIVAKMRQIDVLMLMAQVVPRLNADGCCVTGSL